MPFGQPEIEDAWLVGRVNDDVARLQIAVDDAQRVGRRHGSGDAGQCSSTTGCFVVSQSSPHVGTRQPGWPIFSPMVR